jgi:hypothetical protein
MATFLGAGVVVYAITIFAKLLLTPAVNDCQWPADSGITDDAGELLPPCPPGMMPTVYVSLIAGVVGVVIWVKWGLRIGPQLALFAWPAFHAWWVVPQIWQHFRDDGWVAIFVLLEAGAFAFWPLFVLFSKGARHNLFWSDGEELYPDEENPPPPTPPVEPRFKLWSWGVQLAAIALGVAFGLSVFATLPRPR